MDSKRCFRSIVLLVSLAVLAPLAVEAGEWEVTLKALPGEQGARGGIIIRDKKPLTRGEAVKEITINAAGLKPNAVYTVWLVNDTTRTALKGIGEADYSFKSDDYGNGSYTAYVDPAEFDEWLAIEIARHPDGNPENTSAMKAALKASLLN